MITIKLIVTFCLIALFILCVLFAIKIMTNLLDIIINLQNKVDCFENDLKLIKINKIDFIDKVELIKKYAD